MKLYKLAMLAGGVILLANPVFSQIAVSAGNSVPDPSSILDIISEAKGLKMPTVTKAARLAITSPAEGLLVYQSDPPSGIYFYSGNRWSMLGLEETGSSGVSDIEGNHYPTVRIGNQEWMAANLRVTHYRNGDQIQNITDNSSWTSSVTGAYSWYNNNSTFSVTFGALYNWYALSDARGICPSGWHVSSNADFWTLNNYLGGFMNQAGSKIMAASPANLYFGFNSTGFSGQAGGERVSSGAFGLMGTDAFWGTPDINYENNVFVYNFIGSYSGLYMAYPPKNTGLSVRCVRD